jgi:hypothetical protein
MGWPALLVLLVLLAPPVGATVYYADAARPDDSGDGRSWGTAKQTIQATIDASAAGDTILVKYGDYSITAAILLTSDRRMTCDDGTHDSWDSAVFLYNACRIVAGGSTRVFTVTGPGVTYGTTLRGFAMRGGNATTESPGPSAGGGLYIGGGATPYIEQCLIASNIAHTSGSATAQGGGVACVGTGSAAIIMNSWIHGNTASTSWFGYGGGIYAGEGAYCRVESCALDGNTASTGRGGSGGGIAFDECSGVIAFSEITNNVGSGPSVTIGGGFGGGVYVFQADCDIVHNTIDYNHGAEGVARGGDGGGVYIGGTGDTRLATNYSISHNTASIGGSGRGGGIFCAGSGAEIRDNRVEWNVASSSTHGTASYRTGSGGGIGVSGASGNQVTGNVLVGNTASLYGEGSGGGIYFGTSQEITNNVLAYNVGSVTASGNGGGVWFYNVGVSGVLANNVFYRNANKVGPGGTGMGSALYYGSGGAPAIVNNIFLAHDVAGSDSMAMYCGPAKTIDYNCFHGNPGGNYTPNVTSLHEVPSDPRLVDPEGGDYALDYDSPCIEAGNPTYVVPANGGWIVDIGAIEYTGERHKRAVTGTGELLFGGRVKAKVNVITLGTLSEIDMVVHPNEFHPMAPAAVRRWYDITHVGAGLSFDLTMSYSDGELHGLDEADLVVWRWTGSAWEGPKPPSASDPAANWLTVAGQTEFSAWVMGDESGPVSVEGGPDRLTLSASYPNPFGAATAIAFRLPEPSRVRVAIYNVSGRIVRVLLDADRPAGHHNTVWDGRDASGGRTPSGVYFCRVEAGRFARTRKLVLVR